MVTRLLYVHQYLLLGVLVLLLPYIPGSKYLLPAEKKLISSTARCIVVVALLFYVHGKHLRSCRDGQST